MRTGCKCRIVNLAALGKISLSRTQSGSIASKSYQSSCLGSYPKTDNKSYRSNWETLSSTNKVLQMETTDNQEIARLQKLCDVYEDLVRILEEQATELKSRLVLLQAENIHLQALRIQLTERVKEVARVN
jgi:hypothetical protein